MELNLNAKSNAADDDDWMVNSPAHLTKADIDFNRFFEGKASSAPPMSTGYYQRLFGGSPNL